MTEKSQSFTDRGALLEALRVDDAEPWDLVIVGGGITGAGVLREAARRGYRTLLLEQSDFAWGTSSRSSKMVHGGLRYLASGNVKLTRHSLGERERILKEAPGLVERMGYYFTLRKKTFPNRLAMSIVLTLYDWMAGIRDHRYCGNEELQRQFPGLACDDLKGACYYTDATTDDARLVLRVLQEGIQGGGRAINYVRVKRLLLEDNEVKGVILDDPDQEGEIAVRARAVISATGAWADQLRGEVNNERRVRPLRGSHLVLPQRILPLSEAIALLHPQDKRAVFIFPWEGTTVVGTTDLDHSEDLNIEASITWQEVNYLLEVVRHQFPAITLGTADILSTWAGIRPVIASENSKDPSKERRDHAVWADKGLITVSGGKLTTFRLIALDALNAAAPWLPPPNGDEGKSIFTPSTLQGAKVLPDDAARGQLLLGRYGDLAQQVVNIATNAECSAIENSRFSLAECRWALRHEAVQHLDDLLLRRTRLGQLLPHGAEALLPALEKLFAEELGWDPERWQSERARYLAIWQTAYSLPPGESGEEQVSGG